MSRTTVNFLLDCLLLLIFLALVWVTLALRLLFPPATLAAGYVLWNITYDGWCNIQFALLSAMILGVLFHLMMHWSWVCGVLANRVSRLRGATVRISESSQTLYGVAMLIVLVNALGLALAAANLCVHSPLR